MASFLRNWGKKEEALRQEDIQAEGPASQALPEPNEENSAAASLEEDGIAQPDPLDIDALGGEVAITYESMNGKKQRHYTQIFINPKFMPVITTNRKPDNTEYLAVKHELLSSAYHSLQPYMDFVLSLKGMYERDDLRRALELIVKRFLTRFWDMPASKDSHHAYLWGLTLHCVDVACAEAEKATAWMPMSEHGIDEINHARYLGMVVLLHFTKGLFHDAHKLYQYEMTGYSGNFTVKFDPLRNQGNVLDFKIVYPERTETWGEPIASPGKLNAIEFCALFPRELLKYAPSSQFIEVFTAVFDLEGSDSDRDSAKRDASNAGRATLEHMILNQVKAYFTTDSSTTKPENSVFRVNDDWVAVLSTQFLMKVRPLEGRVYTKDGVKNYLLQEEALTGTATKYDVSLAYRFKRPNGKEESGKSRTKIAFIKASYLLQVFPDLFKIIGQIFFDEVDREAVRALCPSADNFIKNLNKSSTEQLQAGKTADSVPVPEAEPLASEAAPGTGALPAGAEFHQSPAESGCTDEPSSAVAPAEEPCDPEQATGQRPKEPGAEEQHAVASPADAEHVDEPPTEELSVAKLTVDTAPVHIQGSPKPKQVGRAMVKWSDQLMFLLAHYEAGDSCPETGWLFVSIYGAYVRAPRFYQRMTNEQLLEQSDWGVVAAGMCRELGAEGLLALKPQVGCIVFTPPGGGEASVEGAFFELNLPPKTYRELFDRIMKTAPIMELKKQ
jgi:hypothetical protein